jgi:ABC-type transport system involved in cytochrome c biogenesis permease subunit
MKVNRYIPWTAGALALVGALVTLTPPGKVRGFDVEGFGSLPVLEGGRIKPLDSLARNSLLMIRSKQSVPFEGRTIGADEWLLDLMFRPMVSDQQPSFVIDDPEVLGLLRLPQTAGRYFSFATLIPHFDAIQQQAARAQPIDPKQRTRFQGAVVNLFDRIYLYYRLRNTVQLMGGPGLAGEIAARSAPDALERQQVMTELASFRPVLPAAGQPPERWRSVGEALRAPTPDPGLDAWAKIAAAYTAQDAPAFNAAVAAAKQVVRARQPAVLEEAGHEILFNRAQPFYLGMVIYVLAMLVLFASWLWRPDVLQRTAFSLLLVGALVHTAGLASRVILQGRPPVTNLYSSAVFVGWGAVLLGIILERLYRRGFATAVAAASGFASLLVAHHLTGDGDTMEMMRAVLDSNFWLATHVITITIGYSGTFLAGAIAIGYVLRRHLARALDPASSKALVSMTYGIICFALFFSFVGTVLGGIWADQSWGRFWGWDPKENGALLIVLWNAVILHSRWGGYVREKGIMAMAIFGNVITSLSWFGVNMLGVGLHSYGFMDKAFWALFAFIGSQLVLMALCLAPRQFWRARAAEPAPSRGSPGRRGPSVTPQGG